MNRFVMDSAAAAVLLEQGMNVYLFRGFETTLVTTYGRPNLIPGL